MAVSQLVTATPSGINASSLTIPSANTIYQSSISLDAAIYTITCVSGTVATVEFFSGAGTYITTGVTSSGTVTVNLASAADRVRIWTNTGSNIIVTITKIAASLSDNMPSGTLDTITSSGTYTGTSTSGFGYAMVVGGGGGGGGGSGNRGGGGGASGSICGKVVALTGSMSVTIGNGGTGGTTPGASGQAGSGGTGGSTIFGGMTAVGGNGGAGGSNDAQNGAGGASTTGSGGTYNLASSAGDSANNAGIPNRGVGGSPTNIPYPFFGQGTIGTGGAGVSNAAGNAGTGRGAGGSGGNGGFVGGAGTAGVVYVLKF